jgi:hypothetical protein
MITDQTNEVAGFRDIIKTTQTGDVYGPQIPIPNSAPFQYDG